MARPEKTEAVKEIADRFSSVGAALLTEYRGLSVKEIAEVRGALREVDADYRVLKNTLTRIAVRDVGLDELVAMLAGPTAIAFCRGDAVDAAKALDDAARKFPVLVIKGGMLNGRVIDADKARQLARLEPREVQLAKIAMLANSPLQQTVNAFAALLRDLGSMIAQVLHKKESGELPGAIAAAAEPPQPTPDVDQPEGGSPEQQGEPTPAVDAPEGEPGEQEAEASVAPGSSEPAPEEETLENPEIGPAPQGQPEKQPVEESGPQQPKKEE